MVVGYGSQKKSVERMMSLVILGPREIDEGYAGQRNATCCTCAEGTTQFSILHVLTGDARRILIYHFGYVRSRSQALTESLRQFCD